MTDLMSDSFSEYTKGKMTVYAHRSPVHDKLNCDVPINDLNITDGCIQFQGNFKHEAFELEQEALKTYSPQQTNPLPGIRVRKALHTEKI